MHASTHICTYLRIHERIYAYMHPYIYIYMAQDFWLKWLKVPESRCFFACYGVVCQHLLRLVRPKILPAPFKEQASRLVLIQVALGAIGAIVRRM